MNNSAKERREKEKKKKLDPKTARHTVSEIAIIIMTRGAAQRCNIIPRHDAGNKNYTAVNRSSFYEGSANINVFPLIKLEFSVLPL